MIKVIEAKPVPRERITCDNCGSILEYGNVDLIGKHLYNVGFQYVFSCPVCGVNIIAKWIRCKEDENK